ncbi:hypothetical protein [Paenibacillus sp. MMS20-IR301]|uniref:hypothetical protein n=1 Tax=Paenibacillus sp. MMS20-IR301 TaxID=2895946 RepID=UPI0028E2AF79|nr:hypothetical protein [Paenibacillus sp. MMS20-IR301]WNS44768.1 hypothetical protein LOS79_05700 [Paenibacillus sp. MMS20-IR301]
MNIGSLIRGLLGDTKAGEAKTVELKEGQVVRGVVLSVSDSGKEAVVQIQGTPVRAELETPLAAGQTLNLQVGSPGEGGLPVLKPVTLGEAALSSPQSMGEAIESLGLANSKAGREIIQAMQSGGLALTKETAAKLDAVMNAKPPGVPASEWLEAAVISVKRGLPVTAESVRGLQQAVFGPKLHQLLAKLETELHVWAQQQDAEGSEASAGTAKPPAGNGPAASAPAPAPTNAGNSAASAGQPGLAAEPETAGGRPAGSASVTGAASPAEGQTRLVQDLTSGAGNTGAIRQADGPAGPSADAAAVINAGPADGEEPSAGAGPKLGAAAGADPAAAGAAQADGGPEAAGPAAARAGRPADPAAAGTVRTDGEPEAARPGAARPAGGTDPAASAPARAGGNPEAAAATAAQAGGAVAAGRHEAAAPREAAAAQLAAGTDPQPQPRAAASGPALLAKLQGVLTQLRGSLPQLAGDPPASGAAGNTAPPVQASSDTEAWVGRVLKLLGAEHEQQAVRGGGAGAAGGREAALPAAALQGASGGADEAAGTLKGVLLQMLGASEVPPAVKDAAGQLVQQLTGQQLLLNTDRTAPFAQVTMFLPLRGPDGQETASVHIQSRRGRKGELDAANCRLWFDLDMKQLGQTMVDVQVASKIVSLKLHNNEPWVLELLEGRREEIKTAVEGIGYQLSSLRTEPLPEPGAAAVSAKQADYVPDAYKGVDYRI